MTQFLIRLFEAPKVDFHNHIDAMEREYGVRSVDIKLTNKINLSSKEILKYLSLSDDSLSREVYHSLNHFIDQENAVIESSLGITPDTKPEEIIKTIVDYIHDKSLISSSYFVKHPKIKSFIKKHPPKKVMKTLAYRSVDSLLKRESNGLLLSLARELEGSDWHKEYVKFCSNLVGSDCMIGDINLSIVSPRSRQHLASSKIDLSYLVRLSAETGSLALVAPEKRFKNDTITFLVAILDGIYQLRLFGNYFNYISFGKDFGKNFAKCVTKGIRSGTGDNNSIMWPALYRHMSRQNLDEPLIIDENIEKPTTTIAKNFELSLPWHKFDETVYGDQEIVSLNLMDIVTNSSNDFTFDQRYIHSAQQEIWDRLSYEYLKGAV